MAALYKTTRTATGWLLMGLLLLGLAGCFDCELKLSLQSDGGGEIIARYIVDRATAGDRTAAQVLPPGQGVVLMPEPSLERLDQGDKVIYLEKASFPSLSKLGSRLVWFRVELVDIGLIVQDDPTYRLTAYLANPDRRILPNRAVALGARHEEREAGTPPDDPVERKIRALRATAHKAHYFSLTLVVPGRIRTSRSLTVGTYKAEPQVSTDLTSATWRIPVAVLENEAPDYAMQFVATFKGEMKINNRNGDVSRRYQTGRTPGDEQDKKEEKDKKKTKDEGKQGDGPPES